MEITAVRVRKINKDAGSKLKGIVSVTFDDEFVVHDIKIVEGTNGLFLAMPSKKLGEDNYQDIAHPLKSAFRVKMRDATFDAYEKALEEDESKKEQGWD